MRYAERIVIVTGGTKGIGEGCVEVFARAGAHVAFCGLEPELGSAVAARVGAAGPGTATFTACDVTDHGALTAFIGMWALNRLPQPYHPVFNVPEFARASTDRFFLCIEATDARFDPHGTRQFLEGLHPVGVSEVAL